MAEMVSLACVKTVAGDKDFFLGELSTAYLSSARLNVRKGARLDSAFSIYIFSVIFMNLIALGVLLLQPSGKNSSGLTYSVFSII